MLNRNRYFPFLICSLLIASIVFIGQGLLFGSALGFTFALPEIIYREEAKARQIPFDSVLWKAAKWNTVSRGENRVRDYMIRDLLAGHDFHGWSRTEIVALLGEPTDERVRFHDDGLTYSWYRIDGMFDYLLFKYDEAGFVVDYLISYD